MKRDIAGQQAGHSVPTKWQGQTRRDKTGHTPIGVSRCPAWLAADYAELHNDDFLLMLNDYHTLPELAGLWHRRTVLNTDLPRWSAEQRNMMKARKYELERANG